MESINNTNNSPSIEKKFNSPEEELQYLRQKVYEKEKSLSENGESDINKEQAIASEIRNYGKNSPEEVLEKGTVIPENIRGEIVLELSPEEHDNKMEELFGMIQTKGISNVLDIVSKMDDPHVQDDLHRFLVAYIKGGYPVDGFKLTESLEGDLERTLFEIIIPENDSSSGERDQKLDSLKEVVSKMEQFYFGMQSISRSKNDGSYMTIEIANPSNTKEFIFYISVASRDVELLEKQLHSLFPDVIINNQKDDYNIFNQGGESAGAYVTSDGTPAKIIRTIDNFDSDPLDTILSVFTNLGETDEGASMQLVFKPVGDYYLKNYLEGLKRVEKGEKGPEEFHVMNTTASKAHKGVSKMFGSLMSATNSSNKKEGSPSPEINIDANVVESVKSKIEKPIISTNIRIIASAQTKERALSILGDMQSSFNQFENTTGNKLKLKVMEGSNSKTLFKDFSFRHFNQKWDVPLNLSEIATIVHLPSKTSGQNSQLKVTRSTSAPAPLDLLKEGIVLGVNKHIHNETIITMAPSDRLRHFYTVGQTGTGKTNLMKSMIIQDIKNGDGVCMIDPHGSDLQDVLANIPKERYEDVIYFDPAHAERPMGLNMLEYDVNNPEQKTFVVNELFSIFQKLYGGVPESMGPMFEQYFRNATMLVIEDPETGNTLLDVSRVMSDKKFRDLKISRCKNPIVVQFWTEIAEKAGGEASLQNIVPYITSKFDVFLANDIMRPIISQEKSSFNFRDIMDNKKILLVNLSKGKLGDINSNLIGLILIGKILMAALSRVDSLDREFPNFYLYIDEFQNITTDSISTILSEARKYKLSLTLAHQYIAQLQDSIKDAVFGNVGSMAVFRVGSEDAQFLETQFSPTFTAKDIMNIDNFNCYLKILSNNVPKKPFNIATLEAPKGNAEILENLKQLSYLKYGRNKDEVHAEIMKKYQK